MKVNIRSFIYIMPIVLFLFTSCKTSSSDLNIIDGKKLSDEDYPTVIKIGAVDGKCSGIIVSKNVVLTAAHCLFNSETGSLRNLSIEIDGKRLYPVDYVWVDEYKDLLKKLVEDKDISSNTFNSKTIEYDLGAMIFDNIDKKPPFEGIVSKAWKKGAYFRLSSNRFKHLELIQNNKKDIFFLGFGLSGTSDQIKGSIVDRKNLSELDKTYKKQIGYSSFIYDGINNQWTIYCSKALNLSKKPKYSMEDILMSDDCIKDITENFREEFSYPAPGDSGGPLIYKDQVLGIASRSGDIVKGKYTSLTFGSNNKVAERFIKKIKDKLLEKDLLKNNLTISMILTTAGLDQ